MDNYRLSHVLWGFLGVVFARKIYNYYTGVQAEADKQARPVEMRDVDATSLGGPVIVPKGPFATMH
jgi:hypothetical protein